MTIAVKRKNEDVAAGFQDQADAAGFKTFIYEDVYPAGDEYILVYEISGRQIPPGGIPLSVGCVVDNVETIINIAHAVDGKPVIDKYLTVAGAVEQPLTTVVPVGTSIADCIALAGGCTCDDPVVLTGGVMMGGVTNNLTDPVAKTMGGLIVLPSDHYLVRRKTAIKGNVHTDRARPVRSVFVVYRAVPSLHSGLPDRTASRDANAVDDRRGKAAWQPVGAVLLRVQRLLADRLSRTIGPQEHLRRCQGDPAGESATGGPRPNWRPCFGRLTQPAKDARSRSARCTRVWA